MIQQQKQNINRIIAGVTGDVAQIIGTTPNMSQQEDEGDWSTMDRETVKYYSRIQGGCILCAEVLVCACLCGVGSWFLEIKMANAWCQSITPIHSSNKPSR